MKLDYDSLSNLGQIKPSVAPAEDARNLRVVSMRVVIAFFNT